MKQVTTDLVICMIIFTKTHIIHKKLTHIHLHERSHKYLVTKYYTIMLKYDARARVLRKRTLVNFSNQAVKIFQIRTLVTTLNPMNEFYR